ncbi:MAG TPA: PQQ-binding-like beta-propeller repeat protein [Streptosporangiaceae bacterium]
MARKSFTWARRGVLAATLLAVALVPYPVIGAASTPAVAPCHTNCGQTGTAGKILWTRELPGAWTASGGLTGTVPVSGQAYVAVGNGVAAVGLGMDLRAYNSRTGQPRWQLALRGFPANSAIVSVRVWPGVVTAGVTYGPGGSHRAEIVINSATGQEYRWHPATPFGGAVSATAQTTVVVGPGAVTAYDTTTGRVRWSQPTGTPDQAWQTDGPDLYVTVAADGYLGTEPVTALRRIDMTTGRETIVRPSASSFSGTLSGVVGNVVLFSSATGVTAYDGLTGLWMWSLAGVVPEGTDAAQGRFNLTQGTSLLAVDPLTGHVTARAQGSAVAGSAGMFAVRGGVALGIDQGASGEAWGYDLSAQRVIWTASNLPWPHYFVDSSGIGGSAEPDGATVVVAACGKLGPKPAAQPTSPAASASGTSASDAPASSASGAAGSAAPSTSASGAAASPSGSAQATPAQATPAPATPAPSSPICLDPELVAIYR